MKDNSQMDYEWRNSLDAKDNAVKVKTLTEEIQRLKKLISKITDSMTWGNSVVKVVFRDEFFEEKYRLKVENFLKEILDGDEHFILNSQIYDNTELEFNKLQTSLQAEKPSKTPLSSSKTANSVPIYSSEFEDVLHCDEPEPEEQNDKDKPQTMTCFNCLGDHHMKKCPERIDRLRVAANKKEVLLDNSSRYHEEERKNALKPGIISSELRLAMGLKNDQLPLYIYKMRVIGYPPGWMDDAVFETSGLSMYDSDGKAISGKECEDSPENGKKYDSTKFLEYPGFNCPVPVDFKDEWKDLGMVAIQPHQQLSEALKAGNTISSKNMYKRKFATPSDEDDTKKIKNGTNDANESLNDWSPETSSTPKKQECHSLNASNGILLEKSLSISLSKSPGTPILSQGNRYQRLPDANNFAQGITEHLPFENLPDAVGKFEKIRGVISDVQKKLQNIKNES